MRRRRRHDFAARTMRAVMRAPLPAGRKALRDPLASLLGWAAVIAAVALSVADARAEPADLRGELFAARQRGVGIGMWLMQFGRPGSRCWTCSHNRPRGVASRRDGRRNDRSRADGCRVRGVALGSAPAADI